MRDTSSLVNGLWGNRSSGVVTKAREIAGVARGISGVVLGDSRLDGLCNCKRIQRESIKPQVGWYVI